MAIVIGKEYKNAFDGVRRLVEGGCAPPDVSLSGGRLIRGTSVFEYSESAAGIDVTDGGMNMRMDPAEGASWFAPLRGDRRDNGLALWKDLVEAVCRYYHENYSLTDYGAPVGQPGADTRKRTADALAELVRILLPSFGGCVEVRERRRAGGDLCDFYGLSLRVELSSGAGDAVPMLAKMFFKRSGRSLVAVSGSETRDIETFVASEAPEGAKSNAGMSFMSDADSVINEVFSALDRTLRGGRPGIGECLYFGRERDRKAAEQLTKKLSSGGDGLTVSGLRVLGISHVKLPDCVYDVLESGVTVLRAVVTASGRMTLTCAPCGVTLMDSGCIYCTDRETGEQRMFEPDLGDGSLGFTDDDIEYIRANSAFGEHLLPNKCANPKCRRRVCKCRQENIGTDGERLVCRDCPYPEVVFVSGEGKLMYTPDLAFARDEMTLVPRSDTGVCSCCGRTFTAEALKGSRVQKLCGFCRGAIRAASEDSREARRLYKRFSGMLSYGVRLRHIGVRKYCFDDDDITLFVLGEDRYILDKTNIRKRGLIAAPRGVENDRK